MDGTLPSPKTPCSATSNLRIHSPYCEATGPIVQEGFVASRVRALQGLQIHGARPTTHSHSPLTPCPIPRTTKIYEPLTTPVPKALKPSTATPHWSHITPSECVPRRPPPSETPHHEHLPSKSVDHSHLQTAPGPPIAVGGQDRGNITHGLRMSAQAGCKHQEPQKEILSPRAIPPALAAPSDQWDPEQHSDQNVFESTGHNYVLHQRRSVADKLGAMVDRGWVGCDVFGRAFDEQQSLGTYSPTLHSCQERSTHQNSSASDAEHPFQHARGSRSNCKHEASQSQCRSHDIRYGELHNGSTHRANHPIRKISQHHIGGQIATTAMKRRSTTTAMGSTRSDIALPKSTSKRRAWTLHHAHYSGDDGEHQIKLRTLSPCHSNNRQPPQPVIAEHENTGIGIYHKNDVSHPHAENHSLSPSITSRAPSSQVSISTTQQTKRSDSGTSSLIGNFLTGKWLKMVTVERKPRLGDLSRRSSTPLLNTMKQLHTLAECGHDDSGEELKPQEQAINPEKNEKPSQIAAANLVNVAAHAKTDTRVTQVNPQVATFSAGPALDSTAAPSRTSRADHGPRTMEHMKPSPQALSPKPAKHTATSSLTSAQSCLPRSQADGSPLSIRLDKNGKGKGIKKVQVIVSLDGADDLIVEARLQRKRQPSE